MENPANQETLRKRITDQISSIAATNARIRRQQKLQQTNHRIDYIKNLRNRGNMLVNGLERLQDLYRKHAGTTTHVTMIFKIKWLKTSQIRESFPIKFTVVASNNKQ